jgi:hypothetical protein
MKVIRGGAFNSSQAEHAEPALRFPQDATAHVHAVGFRCAADPEVTVLVEVGVGDEDAEALRVGVHHLVRPRDDLVAGAPLEREAIQSWPPAANKW